MKTSTCVIKLRYIFILIGILSVSLISVGCGGQQREHKDNSELESEIKTVSDDSKSAIGNGVKSAEAENTKVDQSESKTDEKKGESIDAEMEREVSDMIDFMTIEEKVAQLFIVYPESLADGVPCVTMAGETTKEFIDNIPVGGVLYMSQNLQSPEQVKEMLNNIQAYSMDRIGIPMFLCVDEEGGQIARIANNNSFGQDNVGDMAAIGEAGNSDAAYMAGTAIGSYLSELGFNLDFAPVADVSAYAYGAVIGKRAFSDDPQVVADMTAKLASGLESKGVISVYKHFPGHGSTVGDPHNGYAYSNKNMEELMECDLIPFQNCIDNNASMIMVGHISLPGVLDDETPASLSKDIITDLLRNSMEYKGIIVTDAMNMGAISDKYDSDEAAVLAFNAGADIVLMPKDFHKAYNGILDAVKSGQIEEEAVDESVKRILRLKLQLKNGNLN